MSLGAGLPLGVGGGSPPSVTGPQKPPSPSPCPTLSPLAWRCREAAALPRCPGGGTVPRPPRPHLRHGLPGDGGDQAAAAGARSRNGHGWAGTPAPRLRARGQEQLVRGLSLTSPRVAAPAWRCPPRHKAPRRLPAAETSRLITRVMPDLRRHRGAQRHRPHRVPCRILRRRLLSVARAGGHGLGTGTGSTVDAEPDRTREVICILAVTLGNVCYKCILELFY